MNNKMNKEIKILNEIIKKKGGRCLLIGGAVIDSILGNEIKDWDIEVYGLSLSDIATTLEEHGFQANMVGASFGIIKTKIHDIDIDLSIPRKENKIGKGHKDFNIEFDPNMTPKEAARRRDLTINSMYLDIDTGEIIDPYNGLADLKQGIIRATDPDTFIEDPLRVLRIMQLLPRKAKIVEPDTIKLCRTLIDEFKYIAKERIFEEFIKLLLKANKPSMGLKFLRDTGWIMNFPELAKLIGCQQRKEWHPEGDVWEHTLMVIDAAAKIRNDIPEDWKISFMFGALLHDVGKPITTTDDLTSPGHDLAGVPIAETFMRRITDNMDIIEKVKKIVANHMRVEQLTSQKSSESAWKRLHNNLRLDICAYISRIDSLYRQDDITIKHEPSDTAMDYFRRFGVEKIKPILLGRHLIDYGLKPGKEFGKILRIAYEIQIDTGIENPYELYIATIEKIRREKDE